MYRAILGDMVGAPYEFDRGDKTKDFEMWNDRVMFTDDTVMTLVPIDKTALDSGLLSEEEMGMINDYHARVYERMKDYFDEAGRKHFERRCEPL